MSGFLKIHLSCSGLVINLVICVAVNLLWLFMFLCVFLKIDSMTVYMSLMNPVIMYGCESWTIKKAGC